MSIIVSKQGKGAQKLERTVIQLENYLQEYVAANPNTLPLHEIDENIKLLVLAREFPTGSGPIDALGIDADGSLYIIETKLYKNADKRTVIAQMLDYGASLWSNYNDPADFITKLDEAVDKRFSTGFSQKLQDFYGLEAEAATEIIERAKQNIREGRFRFVVLMDRLDKRLKDLITFVNQNSRFDILGVEWNFYQHEDFEILIPSLYGAEVKKEVGASTTQAGARGKWNKELFFAAAEQTLDDATLRALQMLYDFSIEYADEVSWGSGQKGSFNVIFHSISTRSLYTLTPNAVLQLNFNWHRDSDVSGYAKDFGKAMESIGFELPPEYMTKRGIPVPPERWIPRLDDFKIAVENIPRGDVAE